MAENPPVADNVFHVQQEISRRELERHGGQIIGITASVPAMKDQNGVLEFCCDVRIGVRENQGLVKDVLIAQNQIGVITDMNVPVIMETSRSGRLTIIARTQIRLPDVSLRTYTYDELDLVFMTNLEETESGEWIDGFGYPATSPIGSTGVTETWIWKQMVTSLDEFDSEEIEETEGKWEKT